MKRTAKSIFVLSALILLACGDLSAQFLKKKGKAYSVAGKVIDLEEKSGNED